MTSITTDELLDRLGDVLARVRNGERFMIVDDGAAVAGLLPVADVRASVAPERRIAVPESMDGAGARPTPRGRRDSADAAELERLREELETRRD